MSADRGSVTLDSWRYIVLVFFATGGLFYLFGYGKPLAFAFLGAAFWFYREVVAFAFEIGCLP